LRSRDVRNNESNLMFQKNKLIKVLNTASLEIPYYSSFQKDLNLDSLDYSEFCKIPVLTKDVIRNDTDALINKSYKKVNEVIKSTSGGSTGEPLIFYTTKSQ